MQQTAENVNNVLLDCLFTTVTAVGKIEFLLEPELWQVLPGGIPYFVVN